MGKLVVIDPGEAARLVEHAGDVSLEDLHRWTRCDCVAAKSLGMLPPTEARWADAWFDDNGLLKADSVPNRRIGPGTIICGSIAICARDHEGASLAMTDDEALEVMHLVETRWERLAPDHPKPDPTWKVTVLG